MSSHSTNPPGWDVVEDGWRSLEELLERLKLLARQDLSPDDFFARFLEQIVEQLGAVGGVVWHRTAAGSAQAVCQLRPDVAGLLGDVASQRFHLQAVEHVARTQRVLLALPRSTASGLLNPTSQGLVFAPVGGATPARYVVELFAGGDTTDEALGGLCSLLETAVVHAEDFERRRQATELAEQAAAAGAIEEFSLRVHGRLDLDRTALTIASEGARLLQGDRVSVLLVEGTRCRTLAISGVEGFDRRTTVVRALEQLGSVVAQGGSVSYPPEQEQAPQVQEAVDAFVDAGHAAHFVAVPLLASTGESSEEPDSASRPPLGVLVVEWFTAQTTPPATPHLEPLARHAALALENAVVCRRWTWFRLASRWWGEESLRKPPSVWRRRVVAALLIVVLLFGLWPVDFHVAASGRLQPAQRRDVFAPQAGVVTNVLVRQGTAVRSGDPLVELQSPALELKIREVLGKRQAAEAALASARALRLSTDEGAQQNAARHAAQEEELKATLEGLAEQYAILQRQREELTVRSPLEGEVISRDLERQLLARPVNAGDLLLRVANVSGPWELELDLPDYRLHHVLAAQGTRERVAIRFFAPSAPSQSYQAWLSDVSESAQLRPTGEPSVPLSASVDQPPADALPGAAVYAQIHCGRRPLAYVWLHDLWEAFETRWWQ